MSMWRVSESETVSCSQKELLIELLTQWSVSNLRHFLGRTPVVYVCMWVGYVFGE